ncbi:hypothetical protein FY526_19420 [Clostridioides difficile]|nr:hypothetical protein FY526_19420 [Clostridioides difficile]
MLDLYLREANQSYNTEMINQLEELFNNTIQLAEAVFEDKAFLLYTKRKNGEFTWYSRPSKLVYDPMMCVLSEYVFKEEDVKKLIEKRSQIISKMEELFKENSTDFNGRNNNKSDVIRRKALFNTLVKSVLEED